ncbi:MAG: DUF3568 family protein [Granulosicoccaceae bacterium]|jgi:hypothetical protein
MVILPACDPVSLTLFGVGASAGVSYTLSGVAYKTFTAPVAEVRKASSKALGNMGITVKSKDVAKNGEETIIAFSTDREIEITLEPISENATRMRTVVKKEGLLFDRATATEIIIQTEKILVSA